MPRWVISSPIHISTVQPAVSEITIRNTFGKVALADHAAGRRLWKDWKRKT